MNKDDKCSLDCDHMSGKIRDEDVVYIGRKPVMSYVLAAVTQYNTGEGKVVLKARGRAIAKAVDVAEIVRHKFIEELYIDDIQIGTEKFEREDGTTSNVSSIEIYLSGPYGKVILYSQKINENPELAIDILSELLSSSEMDYIYLGSIGSKLKDGKISELFYAFEGLSRGEKLSENLKKAISSLNNLQKATNSQYLYEFLYLIDRIRILHRIEAIGSSKETITQVRDYIRGQYPDLALVLDNMAEITDIVSKYTKVGELGDQLYYISEGISLCEKTQKDISRRLHRPYLNLLGEIIVHWRRIYLETLEELRGTAKLSIVLKSKNVAFSDETIALLSVRNEGATSASNVIVNILPSPEYSLVDGIKSIEIIPPGKDLPFEFRIRPLEKEKIRVKFQIQYDDPRNKDRKEEFADIIEFFEVKEVFEKIENPYIAGHPVKTKEMFFGREDIFRFIIENMRGKYQNNTIILHGQRRTGKTSILYQLMTNRLPDHYIPIFVDFQNLPDVNTGRFFFSIQEAISEKLSEKGMNFHSFEVEEFEKYPYIRFNEFLKTCKGILDENQNLVFLFDEFEEIEKKVEKRLISDDIFGYFRSLIQHQDWIIIIFTGTHKLTEMTERYWSIFFNIALHKRISFLEEDEAIALITRPVAEKLEYDDLAIEKILRITANHPYFIQLLCHSLVEYLNYIKTKNYVTITDVNIILEKVIEKGTAHLGYVWEGLSRTEKVLLSILASIIDEGKPKVKLEEINKAASERRISTKSKEMKEALKNLCEKDILKSEKDSTGYSFKVNLVQMWILENKPLNKLIEEELS